MRKGTRRLASLCCLIMLAGHSVAERVPYASTDIQPPTPEWLAAVTAQAPARPSVDATRRKFLVFSLRTGYDHLVIPHVERVLQVLGRKSGAFTVDASTDIRQLASENLKRYDVLVLNNNCSRGPRRNLLLDELEDNDRYAKLTAEQRQARAVELEQSVLRFVREGHGLIVIHGAPTMLNNSAEFTGMVGAAFDYHPPNQEVTLRPVDPEHPLVAAFRDTGRFIHRDEPYCFTGSYEDFDFRPLLSMDVEGIRDPRGRVADRVRYVAWIKPYGAGRVFYCSPSHFPESYQSPTLLRFLLDGAQYAAGDLPCDDSTPRDPERTPR
jgi:type 1 glutamine amidotransferase